MLAPLVWIETRVRHWSLFGATLAAAYEPFALRSGTSLASVLEVAREWKFNSLLFGLLRLAPPSFEARLALGIYVPHSGRGLWSAAGRTDLDLGSQRRVKCRAHRSRRVPGDLGWIRRPDPSGVNVVDYATLARIPADAETLAGYLKYLHRVDPRGYSRAEQIAYWINFHSATTMKIVLDAYPVDSIKEMHEDVVPTTGPWNDVHANVADQNLTLDQLQHGILPQSGGTSGFTMRLAAPHTVART